MRLGSVVGLMGCTLLVSCVDGQVGNTPDASVTDASVIDAGAVDAGAVDASVADASVADASVLDSGTDAGLDGGPALEPRLVFANYVVAIRTYGSSVGAYKREIQEAQAAGLDGFVLEMGSWRSSNYAADAALLFQAANELNSGFKLLIAAELPSDITAADVVAMMQLYGNNPAYFRFHDRPVLSTYAGQEGGAEAALAYWRDGVLAPLRAQGMNVFFVPGFFLTNYAYVTQAAIEADYQAWWHDVVDGFFFFGAAGLPTAVAPSLTEQNESAAAGLHAHGKLFMASVTPQYWGGKQVTAGRRYFEFNGGEGLDLQWRSIINVQKPEWVELVTWNDFGEATYFSPCDDLSLYWNYEYVMAPGFFKTHSGALALTKYYIEWYKRGLQPLISRDSLFYFHRTHPFSATATADTRPPVTETHGGVTDSIFFTTLLPTAADLRVTSGSTTTLTPISAGLQHTRVPFFAGAQHFELLRDGGLVLQVDGAPITETPALYNFTYATGAVTGP
jgi:glucan endo-1,3-alpha-glucosidase